MKIKSKSQIQKIILFKSIKKKTLKIIQLKFHSKVGIIFH